ncbi:MAG: glycoside hydrolase family 3 C-terminal domain-containing protein, partial [Bifidobacteriaceae bacterium]|nr:glycoside hydrolase family 3 C-terminal domain-containing protein [Bifidobacteriaceae bacterium]
MGAVPSLASHPTDEVTAKETAHAQLSRQAATEGVVLLENDGAMPVSPGNVALFGLGAYRTVKGGTGSGDVNQRYTVNVREGLENAGFTVTTLASYWNAIVNKFTTTALPNGCPTASGMSAGPNFGLCDIPLTDFTVQPTVATDTAIYVLPRSSGESADRSAAATGSTGVPDYYLSATELANITLIGQTYRNVVVALNVGGVVDTTFYKTVNAAVTDPAGGQALDSLVLMSQLGQEGGNAFADVLTGAVAPSGKLTDTWASAYTCYPASSTIANNDGDSLQEDYTEGIYVGYRYFDSFARNLPAGCAVNYPFGYGLGYSDFSVAVDSVTATMDATTVKATVTNTGAAYSGKEAVQVYFSAPTAGLDKPYQELAGFGKTDVLAPGESQQLTIAFPTTELSSYDKAQAAYILQGGDYAIRVGASSRDTAVAAIVAVPATIVTERLSNQAEDQTLPTELASAPADFYSYPSEAAEKAAAPRIALATAGFTAPDNASDRDQSVAVDPTSPYYPIEDPDPDTDAGKATELISTTTAYRPAGETDWEGTGAPYAAKTGETVQTVDAAPGATLFDVYAGTVSMEEFVASLSATELATVVEGGSSTATTLSAPGSAGYTRAIEALGIPRMSLADGPAGLRITKSGTVSSVPYYQFATAWPIGTALAQTFNAALVEEVGQAIG